VVKNKSWIEELKQQQEARKIELKEELASVEAAYAAVKYKRLGELSSAISVLRAQHKDAARHDLQEYTEKIKTLITELSSLK
jgi:hypothetical protein